MKVKVNIATHAPRKHVLPKCIASLENQTVKPYEIRVWDNEVREDITDKGKFAFLEPNEYYFTCDDDILYPPDYIERSLEALQKHDIITYHGQVLKGKGLNYFSDHKVYTFLRRVSQNIRVDVAGTGVCAFNTNRFMPDVLQYEEDCMVDMLFSLEAAKAGVDIMCLAHEQLWLRVSLADGGTHKMFDNYDRQSELADEIWDIKNQIALNA